MSVDKSPARVREMFAQIAPRYDLLNHLLSGGIDRYWRWYTVRRLAGRAVAGPALDVCTGTGDLALALARRGRRVVGADFCHPMLCRGEAKRRARGDASAVAFVEADALHLPFSNDAFAVVSVAFGLRNVADTDRGLGELVRVCRPGGVVAVLEFSEPSWGPFRAVYGWYFRRVLPRIGQALARNRQSAYNYLPASVGQFPSGEALAARMRAAGLCDVTLAPLTLGIATLYLGTK